MSFHKHAALGSGALLLCVASCRAPAPTIDTPAPVEVWKRVEVEIVEPEHVPVSTLLEGLDTREPWVSVSTRYIELDGHAPAELLVTAVDERRLSQLERPDPYLKNNVNLYHAVFAFDEGPRGRFLGLAGSIAPEWRGYESVSRYLPVEVVDLNGDGRQEVLLRGEGRALSLHSYDEREKKLVDRIWSAPEHARYTLLDHDGDGRIEIVAIPQRHIPSRVASTPVMIYMPDDRGFLRLTRPAHPYKAWANALTEAVAFDPDSSLLLLADLTAYHQAHQIPFAKEIYAIFHHRFDEEPSIRAARIFGAAPHRSSEEVFRLCAWKPGAGKRDNQLEFAMRRACLNALLPFAHEELVRDELLISHHWLQGKLNMGPGLELNRRLYLEIKLTMLAHGDLRLYRREVSRSPSHGRGLAWELRANYYAPDDYEALIASLLPVIDEFSSPDAEPEYMSPYDRDSERLGYKAWNLFALVHEHMVPKHLLAAKSDEERAARQARMDEIFRAHFTPAHIDALLMSEDLRIRQIGAELLRTYDPAKLARLVLSPSDESERVLANQLSWNTKVEVVDAMVAPLKKSAHLDTLLRQRLARKEPPTSYEMRQVLSVYMPHITASSLRSLWGRELDTWNRELGEHLLGAVQQQWQGEGLPQPDAPHWAALREVALDEVESAHEKKEVSDLLFNAWVFDSDRGRALLKRQEVLIRELRQVEPPPRGRYDRPTLNGVLYTLARVDRDAGLELLERELATPPDGMFMELEGVVDYYLELHPASVLPIVSSYWTRSDYLSEHRMLEMWSLYLKLPSMRDELLAIVEAIAARQVQRAHYRDCGPNGQLMMNKLALDDPEWQEVTPHKTCHDAGPHPRGFVLGAVRMALNRNTPEPMRTRIIQALLAYEDSSDRYSREKILDMKAQLEDPLLYRSPGTTL